MSRHTMGAPRLALGAGLAAIAIALVLVLSGSPPAVTRSGAPLVHTFDFGRTSVRSTICQAGEVLPRDATAIRVWLEAVIGPRVEVDALSGGRVITRGARGSGWTAGSVTIPVRPVPRTASRVTVCVHVAHGREAIGVQGVRTSAAVAAFDRQGPMARAADARAPTYREGPLPGRMVIEYLRVGNSSWWSLARSVARRMGLGHAGSGAAIPLLAAALMIAVAIAMSRLILKEIA
ncbi:MAG TPA: hypothetical protein VN892_18260 [Solirubrobacteraceae bacterium]|nr:hypothetical protein [Solirubrobacteraceae bacterium]